MSSSTNGNTQYITASGGLLTSIASTLSIENNLTVGGTVNVLGLATTQVGYKIEGAGTNN